MLYLLVDLAGDLLADQPASCVVAVVGLMMIVVRGRVSNAVLLTVAALAPVAAGLQAWVATLAMEDLASSALAADLRYVAVANQADVVFRAPLPFFFTLAPGWVVVLWACAWRGQRWLAGGATAILPLWLLGYAILGVPEDWPVWMVIFTAPVLAGLPVAYARSERRETAAIAWAGLVSTVLLSWLWTAEVLPHRFRVETWETRVDTLLWSADEVARLHGFVVAGVAMGFLPLALMRVGWAVTAAVFAIAGAALCSHDGVWVMFVRANLPSGG